jgi:hypothetical protein
MPAKKQNEMKVTIWTGTMKSEMTGSISACVIESFPYIMAGKTKTAAENRETALRLMKEQHDRMTAEGL